MTVPIGRRGTARRRGSFNLRNTALFFGLLALLLGGAGLTLRLTARAVQDNPVIGAFAAVVVLTAVFGLGRARRRRVLRAARAAATPVAHAAQDGLLVGPANATAPTVIVDAPAPEPASPAVLPEPGAASVLETPDEVVAVAAEGEVFDADDYAAMDPSAFEQAIAALCERDGCVDVEVVGGAGDLGADVLATTPDGRRVVIQCKRYGPVNKVGSQEVQRFGGTCYAVHEADVAAVVTTGEFTQPAADYAEQCGIRCVDHVQLVAWTEGAGPPPWREVR